LNPQAVPAPSLLLELLNAIGPSGHEGPAAAVWRNAASAFAEVSADTLGTSFAHLRVDAGAPTLALVAHIDEVGFQVTHIEESGLLAYSVLGGFSAEVLLAQRVAIVSRSGTVCGVVARRRVEGARRGESPRVEHTDLHIDIGAADRDEAASLVTPGDPGVWLGEPLELASGRLSSRALDNRLGAYVALEALRRLAEGGGLEANVVAVAAVQEELGHHGARAAAFALEPQVAVALDVTHATDVPGGDPRRAGAVKLGGGAAISRGPVLNPRVSDLLGETARAEEIAHCFEIESGATHTDADALHVSRSGVPSGLVSLPLRYMHSPVELCSLDDVEAAIELVAAFARRLGPDTSFLR
jgi:endoglucanase